MAKQHLTYSTSNWGRVAFQPKDHPVDQQPQRNNRNHKPPPNTKQQFKFRKTKSPHTHPSTRENMPSEPKDKSTDQNSPNHLAPQDKASQNSPNPNQPKTHSLESLHLKTNKIERLPANYEAESCAVCSTKQPPDWIVTLFDDSWGFLCGPCGFKLSQN
jgi:hypothetical protein